ncbi:hypothetical protein [uncultured Clostridium sp.]|uniref:hypothetical protein n=1 Tax=uncultured Clostridium sp. TaxID=59620 RepID=UPI0025EFE2EF|nr:hypothetical protein [uncultured Clostridium sp.]
MNKEVISKRPLPLILLWIFILVNLLAIKEVIGVSDLSKVIDERYLDYINAIILILLAVDFSRRCKIKYKYFLIDNKLVIHKLKGTSHSVEEVVDFKDVHFLGKKCNYKNKVRARRATNYLSHYYNTNRYLCVYKKDGRYKKFYFQPTKNFIKNIEC